MLPILKAGGWALLFCLGGECTDMPSMRVLVEEELRGNPQKEEIMQVIECESGFDPMIQSQHKDQKGPNGLENSWGLVQINLDYNPQVTREEAQDWKFALEFIKKHFQEDRKWMWSCWKNKQQTSYGR